MHNHKALDLDHDIDTEPLTYETLLLRLVDGLFDTPVPMPLRTCKADSPPGRWRRSTAFKAMRAVSRNASSGLTPGARNSASALSCSTRFSLANSSDQLRSTTNNGAIPGLQTAHSSKIKGSSQ